MMFMRRIVLILFLFSTLLFAQNRDINVSTSSVQDMNRTSVVEVDSVEDTNSSDQVYLKASDTNMSKSDSLLSSSISIEHEGVSYNCSKEDLIVEDHNGTKVYNCLTAKEKRLQDNSDARGTAETERFKQDIKDKSDGEKRVVLVENNESTSRTKWKPFYYTKDAIKSVVPAKVYLSLRFAELYQNDTFTLTDTATRGGFFYFKEFENSLELIFQFEASVRFSNKGDIIGSDSQTNNSSTGFLFGTRLNFVTLKKEDYTFVVGKYWGVYYDIAGMTDKYMVFGALGNGTYNSGTDGGGSGTGRAADVVQLRFKKDVFNIALQAQYHFEDFNFFYLGTYDYAAAFSLFYNGLTNGVKLGVTGNYAHYRSVNAAVDGNQTLSSLGVDGDDIAVLTGLSYQKNNISLDLTLGASKNHVTDDQGKYMRAIGSELYVRYRLKEHWRFAFGFNYLWPDHDYYQGEYVLQDYIASLQFAFNKDYTQLVYLETKYSAGTNADGSDMSSAAALGFRYLLDY